MTEKEEIKPKKNNSKNKKFGTFAGVFMPSVLTILGAVMYFIAPQVLGGVGLAKFILIILIAHSVTLATAFSISAISTNIKVKGGGLYYLISRSLGSEFGGSLGIQLYLAQTIASSFYAIAFARGAGIVLSYMGFPLAEMHIALVSLAIFGLMVFVGANFIIKVQYAIFAAIILSLVSIFLGPQTGDLSTAFFSSTALPFWIAFAMFFPAVTGIDAGVGMSGNLKDPKKSLVRGTFIAIIITMLVYIALAVKFAISASPGELFSNSQIIYQMSYFAPLVLLGILMATSSSALSSLMTAPRCLVAMTEDKILPKFLSFLGKKSEKDAEPRVAITLSLLIGLGVILLGSLELISQVVAMFFLSVYGWINGAAFFEKVSHNPSYRPTFNAPLIISFYGMFASYAVMYLFNPKIMAAVIVIQALLFISLYKTRKSMKIEGVWHGVSFQFLRALLKRIDKSAKSLKNWRPTILAFSTNELNNHPIANILNWIGSRSSVTKLYFLRKGNFKKDIEENKKPQEDLLKYIKEHKLEIFPRTVITDNYQKTIENLAQAETLGNLPLNTVLLDFNNKMKINELASSMKSLKKNIIIMRNQTGFSNFKRVDVWWSSRKNGNFMILLAYLITHSKQWLEQGAVVKVFYVDDAKEGDGDKKHLENILEQSRMENVELEIVSDKQKNIKEIINSNSTHADLVILGLTEFENKTNKEVIDTITSFTEKLKVSLIVSANDKIDFRVN
ncbi:MAG: amino acid permease [Nanoarchaeota archaeon]|nr:amino acid permease [Nanoarchaeota archaeon]